MASNPNNVMVTLDFIDLLYNDTPIDELKGFYYASSEFDIPGKNPMAPAFRDRFKAKYGKVPKLCRSLCLRHRVNHRRRASQARPR